MREEILHSERGGSTHERVRTLGAEGTMRNMQAEVPHAKQSGSAHERAGSLQELLQRLWPAIPEREQPTDGKTFPLPSSPLKYINC